MELENSSSSSIASTVDIADFEPLFNLEIQEDISIIEKLDRIFITHSDGFRRLIQTGQGNSEEQLTLIFTSFVQNLQIHFPMIHLDDEKKTEIDGFIYDNIHLHFIPNPENLNLYFFNDVMIRIIEMVLNDIVRDIDLTILNTEINPGNVDPLDFRSDGQENMPPEGFTGATSMSTTNEHLSDITNLRGGSKSKRLKKKSKRFKKKSKKKSKKKFKRKSKRKSKRSKKSK